MLYFESLREKATECGNILCFGIDPLLEKIPLKGSTEERITKFYSRILEAAKAEGIRIPSVKPNIAFFEQYGFEGMRALKNLIPVFRKHGSSIILDAKRGDIGKTASAYAQSVFGFWKADAVTLSPYMGFDGIKPFMDKGNVYVLVKTSNNSEIQDLNSGGKPLYYKVAELVLKWDCGAVVGATHLRELEEICSLFRGNIPLLIPGIGSQGGNPEEVMNILKKYGGIGLHRVNSSSAISYAFEKNKGDYIEEAIKEIKRLLKILKV